MDSFNPKLLSYALLSLLLLFKANSFNPLPLPPRPRIVARVSSLQSSVENAVESSASATLRVPLTWEEMVRQVSSAIKEAAGREETKQIVRILLPRDAASGDFGILLEQNGEECLANAALVPPDESWQGGIMQLYRAGAPTCRAILRQLTATNNGGLPAKVVEDRSVDESGVDGVGLFTTSDGTVSCWLQPTQDNVDDIVAKSKGEGKIQVLINPQWRTVDDALDSASKGEGLLAGVANFLGGKGRSLQKLADAGFKPVYTLEGYVCRGSNVRLMQVLDSDWNVFCERDDKESFLLIGKLSNTRPTYQQVDELLQKADIGFKYARDIGFSPKL